MRRVLIACLVCVLASALSIAGVALAQEEPELGPGFQSMAELLPVDVGQPLEPEGYTGIGNGLQQTSDGLFVWHNLTNTTDFTDGANTWVLSPEGLLVRSNDERFDFEILQEQLELQAEAQLEAQPEAQPEQAAGPATFRVTLENLTPGQPLSPPVAATHDESVSLFDVGGTASDELASIARNGDAGPMTNLLSQSQGVTQVVTRTRLEPGESVTFDIQADPGDTFSLATMLGCTNDGFTGIDSVELSVGGQQIFLLPSWDAGREQNTENIEDLPDRCGIPVGEPTNRNAEVATIPFAPIDLHPGILGVGQLDPTTRGWTDPVARLTIERVAPAS